MPFTELNLESFPRGDDWTVKLVVRDADNVVIDITGYTYWLTLKSDVAEADPGDAQVSVTPPAQDAVQGTVYLTIPRAQTDLLTPGTYKYDVQQVDTTGRVTTLLIGKVRVVADITRSTA